MKENEDDHITMKGDDQYMKENGEYLMSQPSYSLTEESQRNER